MTKNESLAASSKVSANQQINTTDTKQERIAAMNARVPK